MGTIGTFVMLSILCFAGELSVFHVYLFRHGLTTYEYIMRSSSQVWWFSHNFLDCTSQAAAGGLSR